MNKDNKFYTNLSPRKEACHLIATSLADKIVHNESFFYTENCSDIKLNVQIKQFRNAFEEYLLKSTHEFKKNMKKPSYDECDNFLVINLNDDNNEFKNHAEELYEKKKISPASFPKDFYAFIKFNKDKSIYLEISSSSKDKNATVYDISKDDVNGTLVAQYYTTRHCQLTSFNK